jgi:hypothetical protein
VKAFRTDEERDHDTKNENATIYNTSNDSKNEDLKTVYRQKELTTSLSIRTRKRRVVKYRRLGVKDAARDRQEW